MASHTVVYKFRRMETTCSAQIAPRFGHSHQAQPERRDLGPSRSCQRDPETQIWAKRMGGAFECLGRVSSCPFGKVRVPPSRPTSTFLKARRGRRTEMGCCSFTARSRPRPLARSVRSLYVAIAGTHAKDKDVPWPWTLLLSLAVPHLIPRGKSERRSFRPRP